MSQRMHLLLGPALEAGRSALRDLDADQVPNDLRRVRGYGGALPPPLAASLLRGLEQYEWLREKAAEHLAGGEGAREAAALYLERPPGWELSLAGLAAEEAASASAAALKEAAGREEALAASLKASRAKVKAAQKEGRTRAADLERRLSAAAAERRSEAAGEARDDRAARREVERALQAAERAREERDAAREEARAAREDLKGERAHRRRAEAAAAERAATGAWVGDPRALAERLDQTAVMARPAAPAAAPGTAPGAPEAGLPAGVAPDRPEAIAWLLGLDVASVVVDGYNVGYLASGERSPAAARARVEPMVNRLVKAAAGRMSVVVVFDSSLGAAETPPSPGPVTIRYSDAGETADDEIVRLAAGLRGTVVVVSDDRAVRERSEAAGAVALWSKALIAWAGRR